MNIGLLFLGIAFLYMACRFFRERWIWNKGICRETGSEWEHIATEGVSELHRTSCGTREYWFHFHFRR